MEWLGLGRGWRVTTLIDFDGMDDMIEADRAFAPDQPPMLRLREGMCPSCGTPDLWDVGEQRIESSGSGFNSYFGLIEHWWSGTIKCPRCGEETPWGDSSL